MRQSQRRRRQPIPFIGLQGSLFIVLVGIICLERILSGFTIAVDVTCEEHRTLMFGATSGETGIHDLLIWIAFSVLAVIIADIAANMMAGHAQPKNQGALKTINVSLAFGILALCAVPWAYYNVGHPLSDRIYQVQNMLRPSLKFIPAPTVERRAPDPNIWECSTGECSGAWGDVESIFVHRETGVSYRSMLVADCMSPEFNRATMAALGRNIDGYDGDRRRFAHIYFDQEGRFVGPNYKSINTRLLRSQLSPSELEPPELSLDEIIDALWGHAEKQPRSMAKWVSWEQATEIIESGRVSRAYEYSSLLIQLNLNDGSVVVGTQPRVDALKLAIDACGNQCSNIWHISR